MSRGIPALDLENSGRLERFDMLLSACLAKKLNEMRPMRNLPVQEIHLVAELDRVEQGA